MMSKVTGSDQNKLPRPSSTPALRNQRSFKVARVQVSPLQPHSSKTPIPNSLESSENVSSGDERPRLLVFTRFPKPGSVKTRLIPALGPEGAADVHREMTHHTLRWAAELQKNFQVHLEVWFSGGGAFEMRALYGDDFEFRPQSDGDLGRRLSAALNDTTGSRPTVVVGTDCPDLSADHTRRAFLALSEHDVVLGPALDGGYYLLGLKRFEPALFQDVAWGTATVLEHTQRIASEHGLSVALLNPLPDVDEPADLVHWHRVRDAERAAQTISIVIPTINEAENLPRTLAGVADRRDIELIIVDGGSTDSTCSIAERFGAKVLRSPLGRGMQLNVGAQAASGSILLFLHADTRLPSDFPELVRQSLEQTSVVAGAFRLRIDDPRRSLRIVEWGVDLRSRRLHLPYGDQALFLRKNTFDQIGGFPDWPLLEDVEIVRRLRRRGRIVIVPTAVLTSARRWNRLGVVCTTVLNQIIILLYRFGMSPHRLAAWYHRGSVIDHESTIIAAENPVRQKDSR